MNHNTVFQLFINRANSALEVYSNVHRGMGQFSLASTALYEQSRNEVLRYFSLSPRRYEVIFCSPSRLVRILEQLPVEHCQWVCSADLGLAMGVCALAVRKTILPKGDPTETGGGIVQLVTEDKVIWHRGAERFEVGTPPIFTAIMLGIALQMIRESSDINLFQQREPACAWSKILTQDAYSSLDGEALLTAVSSSLVGHEVPVPTSTGLQRYVNLDGAASTPTFQPVWQAFQQTLTQPEEVQPRLLDQSEDIVRAFFNAPYEAYDFLFACNASEAINFAARNLAAEDFGSFEPVVLNSLLDHHSNELPWRFQPGLTLKKIPVDSEGFYDLDALESMLVEYNEAGRHGNQRIILVTVNGASNVLGTFNDLDVLSSVCHRHGARFFVDGAQLSAHHIVDLLNSGIDYYAFSAHKIYSPFGTGGLFLRKGLLMKDEDICRSGLSNIAGVTALAKSLDLLGRIGMENVEAYELHMTQSAIQGMNAMGHVRLYGMSEPDDARFRQKGPVISFDFNNIPHNLVSQYLAEWGGIGTRTGCFCVHMLLVQMMGIRRWRNNLAKFLLFLGLKEVLPILPGLVRISFGIENNLEDVQRLLETMEQLDQHHENALNRWLASVHEGTWLLPRTKTGRAIKAFTAERVRMVFPK